VSSGVRWTVHLSVSIGITIQNIFKKTRKLQCWRVTKKFAFSRTNQSACKKWLAPWNIPYRHLPMEVIRRVPSLHSEYI
jgi:hypothetical protein